MSALIINIRIIMSTDSRRILQDGSSDDGSSDECLHTCRCSYIAYCWNVRIRVVI